MTAPEPRPGGLDSNARGLIVLVAAIVVGGLLLWSWGDDGSTTVDAGKESTATTVDVSDLGTTTTGADAGTTSTTAATSGKSPSEVSVIVLNGSGQTGVAASTSSTIGESGYVMLTPANAPANVETTTVYYADGFEAEAIAVAQVLGKGTDAVKPVTEASLGGAEGDADVVVVLGADTPPASGGSTSGSSTTTTSAG